MDVRGAGANVVSHRVSRSVDSLGRCDNQMERWRDGAHVHAGYCSKRCPHGDTFRTSDFPADVAALIDAGHIA